MKEKIDVSNNLLCGCTDENLIKELLSSKLTDFKYKSIGEIYKFLKDTDLLNYSLSFSSRYVYDIQNKNFDNFGLVKVKKIINFVLDSIGFTNLIKDYIVIIYISKTQLLSSSNNNENLDTLINYDIEILFDVSKNISVEELKLSLNNYFNYSFFIYDLDNMFFFKDPYVNYLLSSSNDKQKEYILNTQKKLIEKFEPFFFDRDTKVMEIFQFKYYIQFLMDGLFHVFLDNPTYEINKQNFEDIEQITFNLWKKYLFGQLNYKFGGPTINEFYMVKNLKKEDNLQLDYLKNFINDSWYSFPRSQMFKRINVKFFDEKFLMEGAGVYKQYIEDISRD